MDLIFLQVTAKVLNHLQIAWPCKDELVKCPKYRRSESGIPGSLQPDVRWRQKDADGRECDTEREQPAVIRKQFWEELLKISVGWVLSEVIDQNVCQKWQDDNLNLEIILGRIKNMISYREYHLEEEIRDYRVRGQ